mgnify:CR=1 FL=1
MKLAFRIALRFLTTNKGQTILIALGIAVGISVQIFIGSLIQGLQISLVDATIGRSSHITVLPSDKNASLEGYQDKLALLIKTYPEITAATPTLTKGAFLALDDSDNTEQVLIRGIEFSSAQQIYQFDDALVDGKLPSSLAEVVVGIDLANSNGLAIGDSLELVIPERVKAVQEAAQEATLKGTKSEVDTTETIKIVGIMDFKVAAINSSWILGSLQDVQAFFSLDDSQVSAIEMQISSPFDADMLADSMLQNKDFDKATFENVKFDNWKAQNGQLLSGLSGQSTSSYIIQVFVVISVVLAIASVLAISVLQKSRQLGILKAMGISDPVASLVFLWQGVMLGILGGFFGILLGLGLLWSFTNFALKPDGTPVVPIYINVQFILLSGGIAVLSATLASVMPALKSRKLSVIEVIKNG